MSDQADLSDMQHRLDDLEDRLGVEYPTPDTSVGALQRLRLEVPTPWSVLTIGARGTGASEGQAIGPGGFGLWTDEHLGAQIRGNTCIDTDGLTIVHSIGATRILTRDEDLEIAANTGMRLGTTAGDVELTAGDVPVHDPGFTVVPSMLVPAAPEVDTGTPREATEAAKGASSSIWDALELASGINTWLGFVRARALSSGIATGTLFARIAGVINAVRTGWVAAEAAAAASALAAVGFDLDRLDAINSEAPKAKIHGAGGVVLTSPEGVSAFAPKISLTGRDTASLKAALKVSVKSAGYASLYGGGTVSVSSEGPAVLKSSQSAATLSGKYAEVSAKDTAVVRSDGRTMISGKTAISVEAPNVAVGGGEYVGVSSGDMVQVEAPFVYTWARKQNTVSSQQKVVVKGNEAVEVECGSAKMTVKDGEFRLDAGSGRTMVIDRQSLRCLGFRLERGQTRIRGNVDLG